MVIKYTFREEDIPMSGPDQLLPDLFGIGQGGMRRFAIAEDEKLRSGFTKILKDKGFDTFFWYDETWYIIHGKMSVQATTRATNAVEKFTLDAGDAFYIPTGTHILTKVLSEKVLFMYVAVPSSSKDGRWLAHLTPQDIEDIRKRHEFKSKDPWTSGKAGK